MSDRPDPLNPLEAITGLPARLELVDVPITVQLPTDPPDQPTTVIVAGYVSEDFPGLAVTASNRGDDLVWAITHLESGYSLGTPVERLETNLLVAARLAERHDWTEISLGDDLSGLRLEVRRYATLYGELIECEVP